MFDFIKEINSTLYKDFDDVNKNIKLKTTITETALQIYSEILLKIINDNEKVDCRNKLSLGKLLENENFVMILKKKYNFSEDLIRNLNIINNLSNDHKHENRSEFISKELKKMYRKIVYCTLNYYNVTFGKKLELNNIDDYYDTLLEVDQELIKNLQEEIRRSYEESNKDKDKQLQEERQKLKIQQQRLDIIFSHSAICLFITSDIRQKPKYNYGFLPTACIVLLFDAEINRDCNFSGTKRLLKGKNQLQGSGWAWHCFTSCLDCVAEASFF